MEYAFEETALPAGHGIAIRETHTVDELPAFFMGAFPELGAFAGRSGAAVTGMPFARYWSPPPEVDVELVMPVAAPLEGQGRVRAVELEGGAAVQALHVGPYDEMHAAYAALERWLAEHGRVAGGPVREVYLNSPAEVASPAEYRTLIVQPLG